jgi:hypothetical protein
MISQPRNKAVDHRQRFDHDRSQFLLVQSPQNDWDLVTVIVNPRRDQRAHDCFTGHVVHE